MILETLIIFLIVLLVAHALIHIIFRKKYSKQSEKWNFEKEAILISRGNWEPIESNNKNNTETEIILPKTTPKKTSENDFLNYGKVIANEQKIKLLTFRIETLEKTLAQLIKSSNTTDDVDIEKIDFKIKVLETEIEKLRNSINQPQTFFGKKNDPLEKEIKALAFNSKRK